MCTLLWAEFAVDLAGVCVEWRRCCCPVMPTFGKATAAPLLALLPPTEGE